jgi:hypothetical protein
MSPRPASSRRHLPSSPFNNLRAAEEVERFAVDEHVHHDKFGLGRVLLVEEETVTVVFGSQQVRIASPYHKLTKL